VKSSNAHFRASGPKYSPLHFQTERVAETTLRASWFWPSWARFPGTWGIFSSPGDSKLTPDGLGLQWNRHNKSFKTVTYKLLGWSIAPPYFKTERVAETAIRPSWFWPTSGRFPGTWGIFCSPGDSTLTRDGLGLQWNWHSKTFWTLTFELVGRNIAPLHFKIERVADTPLRATSFWPTSARFPGTCGIFYSPGDCKLFPNGLVLQWNGHSKTFWTLTFDLLGRNIAQFHFKTERVAETFSRASWVWATLIRFAETWGIFSTQGDSKLTPHGLSFQ